MKEKIAAMKAQLAAMVAKSKEMLTEAEKKPDDGELQKLLSQTITDCKKLRDQIADLEALNEMDAFANEPASKPKTAGIIGANDGEGYPESDFIKTRNLKHFKEGTRIERERKAYAFGQYALASVRGDVKAAQWLLDRGFKIRQERGESGGLTEIKTMKETVNISGGFLVPTQFDQELIDLRETFGVFRQHARVKTMTSDKLLRSRRTSGLTAYFAAEAGSATESEKNWDQVELSAKKLMTYTRFSSELAEDAILDIADDLMGEIGYAFANKEDECGFNGTGASTYGGIVGVRQSLLDVYTTSGGVGLVVGSGSSYSALTLADFDKVMGSLPEFAERPDTAWYVSKFFWGSVMSRLLRAAGGTTSEELEDGRRRVFNGYPVIVSQVMPKVTASAQVCALFGSLSLAADFGDRRRTTISASGHRYHDTDEIGVLGTGRFDIKVHSVGNTTDAGPIVGLITA